MYALSRGVQRMNEILPSPVYALLSGLNASTVGIIALAAVQLAEKAIKDNLTRILVIIGACAGLCYNALWYFPILMLIGGSATVIWDGWMSQKIGMLRVRLEQKRRTKNPAVVPEETGESSSVPLEERIADQGGVQRRTITTADSTKANRSEEAPQQTANVALQPDDTSDHSIRIRTGITITVLFFGISTNTISSTSCILTSVYSVLHRHPCLSWRPESATTRSQSLCEHVPRRHGHLRWRPRRHPSVAFIRRRSR